MFSTSEPQELQQKSNYQNFNSNLKVGGTRVSEDGGSLYEKTSTYKRIKEHKYDDAFEESQDIEIKQQYAQVSKGLDLEMR